MVNKAAIARNLSELDSRYKRRSRNPRDPLYCSKLSLIELCGWIEVTMDSIIRRCAKKHVKDAGNLVHVEKRIIQRTHSFSYSEHFRDMLIRVIGLANVERLERNLDPIKFELLKSSLGTLKEERDRAAHTHLSNVTQTLSAPSTITRHFWHVYDGLKDLELCVRRLSI